MKKILLILAVFAMAGTAANAQAVWGVRFGANFSTMNYKWTGSGVAEEQKIKGKPGLDLGVVLYQPLQNNFYLNSGLLFSMDNFEESDNEYQYSYTYKEHLNYLTVPLQVGYAFEAGNNLNLYVQAGPYFAFKLSEKYEETWSSMSGSGSSEGSGYEGQDDYADFNAGIGISAGVNLNRFKVEIGYKHGLMNIINKSSQWWDPNNETVKIGNTFLGVSYVF
jgi:hypothetical protein